MAPCNWWFLPSLFTSSLISIGLSCKDHYFITISLPHACHVASQEPLGNVPEAPTRLGGPGLVKMTLFLKGIAQHQGGELAPLHDGRGLRAATVCMWPDHPRLFMSN